jgi:electron transport complex protein RnfD
MAFWIASSPHNHNQAKTPSLMRLVIYAALPGILAQWYFFGWGNLIHIGIALLTAIVCEFTVLSLRKKPIIHELFDGSGLLTAVLLGICLPALAPWWISVIGTVFAIVIAKQLYGGLGYNPFNPAMVGYVALLVSFPLEMTLWQPPLSLLAVDLTLSNTITTILTGFTVEGYSVEQIRNTIDGVTMATPLDTLKTSLTMGYTALESLNGPVFGDHFALGWEWVNAGFLLGGVFLMVKKAITWHAPLSFLGSLFICSLIGFSISPDSNASTMFHWFSGATMLGAFFIITDPVSGATSNRGRIVVGIIAGLLVYLIRTLGGYPDGVAFAILLCNMATPLIDQYTRPRTYGHLKGEHDARKS